MNLQDRNYHPSAYGLPLEAIVINDANFEAANYLMMDLPRFVRGTASIRFYHGVDLTKKAGNAQAGVRLSIVSFVFFSTSREVKAIIVDLQSTAAKAALTTIFRLDLATLIFHEGAHEINELYRLGLDLSERGIYDTYIAQACASIGICQGSTTDGRRLSVDDSKEKELSSSARQRFLSIEGQIYGFAEPLKGLASTRNFLPVLGGRVRLSPAVVEKATNIGYALHVLRLIQIERYQYYQSHLNHYEFPFLHVAAKMERIGAHIDRFELAAFRESTLQRLTMLEQTLFTYGVTAPISEDTFADFLVQRGLDRYFRQTNGRIRLDKDVLEELTRLHPAIGEYREHKKLFSFVNTNWGTESSDGRTHSAVDSVGFTNNRISFRNPALPSIVKESRRVVTGQGDNWIIHADFSQFDPTILAGLSNDQNMIADLSTGNLYAANAQRLFGDLVAQNATFEELTSRSKTVCLSVIYSAGPLRLSSTLGVSFNEAVVLIDSFFAAYPCAKKFLDDCEQFGLQHRAVRSLTGLCRWMGLQFTDHEVRSRSRNSPIQMMASTILKLACIRIDERLRHAHPSSFIFLTNHDAILVECPKSEIEGVSEIVMSEMKAAVLHFFPGSKPGVKLYAAKYWSDKLKS